jgi:hypothetical protein
MVDYLALTMHYAASPSFFFFVMPSSPLLFFSLLYTMTPKYLTLASLMRFPIATQMPSNASNSPSYFFHSQAVGPAHVINLSPYVDYTPGSPQWQWLAEDLSGINRSVTPWVIVDIHNPW